ncbi:MAG TPA: histidine kinase [Acetivibrio sp.]|uniref:sensor histidine kinase n=1 Tax=Acetivibrio sp. TaxID=1872092 RepID=UPI002BB16319|nr:histidine kinase [Acetivibrio sp.]HOM03087.1 histidine kinase [Acetivibrio sp.]
MANYKKVDTANLDKIIKKTVEAINNSKTELFDIAESARKECQRLEKELVELKQRTAEIIQSVGLLEIALNESKKQLMLVSKNYDKYSEDEIREAYENADNIRVELAIKREREQYYIKRRNELELRLKNAYKTVEKADNLISQIGVSLSYLTGDLENVSLQIEDMKQKRLLGLKIIKAQEEERQRVAREIHDGPAQLMSNIVLKAEMCERLVDSEPKRAKEELKTLRSCVRDTLRDVRKIIYDLRPMSLDDLGLIPTLQRYLETCQEESELEVSFKTRGAFEQLRPAISLTVFRLVQEAVNNIKKHAHANKVVINLEFLEKELKLYIADDGVGFEPGLLKTSGKNINSGFGLISMRERVELLDGKFEIDSTIGKGTRLNITLPLIPEEGVSNG